METERAGRSEPQEEIDWTPSIILRPHHMNHPFVKEAILRKRRFVGARLGIAMIGEAFLGSFDASGYYYDQTAYSLRGVVDQWVKQEAFFSLLEKADDDAVVHLDLQKDGICESCAIGRHCHAVDLSIPIFDRIDKYEGQTETGDEHIDFVLPIQKALIRAYYRKGIDFINRETSHQFYDYDGRTLREERDPQPVTVTFNSLLVKMGPLRHVLKTVEFK